FLSLFAELAAVLPDVALVTGEIALVADDIALVADNVASVAADIAAIAAEIAPVAAQLAPGLRGISVGHGLRLRAGCGHDHQRRGNKCGLEATHISDPPPCTIEVGASFLRWCGGAHREGLLRCGAKRMTPENGGR